MPRIIKPNPKIATALVYNVGRFVAATLRWKVIGAERIDDLVKQNGKGVICVLWHGRSFVPLLYFRGRGYWSPISTSRDGEYQDRIYKRFGFNTVRGSSSARGAVESTLTLLKHLKAGDVVATTPDGPKGPSNRAQPGVIFLAAKSGCPILPVGISASHRTLVPSWDRFQIPHPFAKAVIVFGEPIYVPADVKSDEDKQAWADKLSAEIDRMEQQAEHMAGHVGPPLASGNGDRQSRADMHSPGVTGTNLVPRDESSGMKPEAKWPSAVQDPESSARALAGSLASRGRPEDYLLSVIDARAPRSGVGPALARGFLGGCAGLYDVALESYLVAERVGVRRRDRLTSPVISVGNLTVGGTGKTPMTAMLCRRLQSLGLRVTILSRGHGGSSHEARVVSDIDGRVRLSAEDAGDEPVLLAQLCPGIPVVVGKDRRLSGREALRNWPVDVFVLDDGFQFWQLVRDLDIVLLDSLLPFDNGRPLPRGLLREPARHIRRGGMAVVTRANRLDAAGKTDIEAHIHEYAPRMPVHFADHAAVGYVPLATGGTEKGPAFIPSSDCGVRPLSILDGASVVAVSAIAQPESFVGTLRAAGVSIAGNLPFDDHHKFTPDDVRSACSMVAETGASALVMTEKDAVKWPAHAWAGEIPLYSLRIGMEVQDEARFVRDVVAACGLQIDFSI